MNILCKTSLAIANILLGFSIVNTLQAQAAAINYDFDVSIDSGALAGDTISGSFGFDDAFLTGIGDEFLSLDALDFSFQGIDYTEADDLFGGVAFFDGEFLGLEYSPNPALSFVTGFFDLDEAYFTYDIPAMGAAGAGNIIYSKQNTSDPEPQTTPEATSILAILTLGGVVVKTKRKAAMG